MFLLGHTAVPEQAVDNIDIDTSVFGFLLCLRARDIANAIKIALVMRIVNPDSFRADEKRKYVFIDLGKYCTETAMFETGVRAILPRQNTTDARAPETDF